MPSCTPPPGSRAPRSGNREVERQDEGDRVRHHQVRRRNRHGLLVRIVRAVRRAGLALALRELRDVAEVVALHLVVEHLALARGRRRDQAVVDQRQDLLADPVQLSLHADAYAFAMSTFCVLPLLASFCSTDEMMRHDARRDPTAFLYATEMRLRSSTDSSWLHCATTFMCSAISSYRSACSASLAKYTFFSRSSTIAVKICSHTRTHNA